MDDENGKSSKKHAASESNGSAAKMGDDGNPSKSKRARRATTEDYIAASSPAAAASTPVVHDRDIAAPVPVPRRCILLSTADKLIVPPPPPPTSKPPEQTSSIKCVFIGPCESERTAFIQSFVHRGEVNGQKKLPSSSKKNGSSPSSNTKTAAPSSSSVWSMEYSKKEYSYQSTQDETSTVLLQFYNVSCQIETQQQQQKPPAMWKSLCSSFDHVVLVLSLMPELLTEDYTNQQLTRTIETWKSWMDSQCVPPSSSGYPMSLLLTFPTRTTVDMDNNGVASTLPSTSTEPHPSMLIRLGASLEIARQKFGFLKWYLWDLNNNKQDGQGGTDSMDEIIQSLVESTKAVVPPASVTTASKNNDTTVTSRSRTTVPATPPPSRRSTDSMNDVTGAGTTTATTATNTAKTPASSSGDTPGPDTPAPSRANGASP